MLDEGREGRANEDPAGRRPVGESWRLASFPELNPDPVLEADLADGGPVTYANPAARELFPDLMAAGLAHPLLADLPRRAAPEPGEDGGPGARGTVIVDEVEVGGSSYRRVVSLLSGGRLARVYLTDVTERRRAEAALRKSEERLVRLFEQASDALFVHDLSGNLVDANRRACESLGYSREELLGLSVADIEEGFDAADLARLWGRVTREGPVTIEGVHRRRDGSAFPVEVRVGPLEVDGRPLVLALARDAAERKRAEAELREAEGRYRTLVEQMPVATYTQEIDHGGATAYASPRMEAITGYAPEEWAADPKLWEKTLHPDDRERVLAEDARTDRTGEPFVVEHRVVRKDGRVVWIRDEAVLVHDGEGKALYWQGVVSDVTERKEAEEALKESEGRFRRLFEGSVDALLVHDEEGCFVDCNEEACRSLGYSKEELLSLRVADIAVDTIPDGERRARRDGTPWRRAMAAEPGTVVGFHENAHRRKDGTVFPVEVGIGSIEHGGRRLIFASCRDITQRRRAEEKAKNAEGRYRALVERMPAVTYVSALDGADDGAGACLYASPRLEELTGYTPKEWIEDPGLWARVVHPDDRGRFLAETSRARAAGEPFVLEYRVIRKGGGRVAWVRDEAVPAGRDDGNGRPPRWQGFLVDVTERKALEERLEHRALHDPLTGLPNRTLFLDRLDRALSRAERGGNPVAVLFLDLDNFKVVNDSLGHRAGDRLLVAAAGRLASALRPADSAARLGGDEFVVLVEGVGGPGDAARVAERIAAALAEPFALEEREVFVTASVGIVLGVSGSTAEGLLRDADLAMYGAKRNGKASYRIFDPSMNAAAHARLGLESDLRRAIERDEFVLHYQPKVFLGSGEPAGVEALLRWEHPRRGMVSPGEFIPVAEETGLIVPIGRWALREACRQAREWHEAGESFGMVSVNLSARQFRHRGLAREVGEVLRETGLAAQTLVLEITESAVMEDAGAAVAILGELKALGVRIAVDDFGTGYSSMNYLKRFPVDFLKIDRSFVRGMEGDEESAAIVVAMVELAGALGLTTVAEGVENAGQLARLREMGCELAQGFYFARPMPAGEIEGIRRPADPDRGGGAPGLKG